MKRIFLFLVIVLPLLVQAQTAAELSNILSASGQDYQVTGQGSQLTLGNNITLATAGSGATDAVSGGYISYRSVNLQIVPASGTVTAGVITFEGSNDNFVSTALPVYLYDLASITAAPVVSYTIVASTPRYFGGNVYFKYFRARISTGITGTTTGVQAFVTYKATPFTPTVMQVAQPTAGSNNTTVTGTVTANQGTANAAAWLATLKTSATSLSTTFSLNSLASNNANFLKSSAGNIYIINLFNSTASVKYVRFYNKTSAPTVGTDVPIAIYAIPATGTLSFHYSTGLFFSTGIAYAITGGATVADNTAVAAADVLMTINYN